MPDKIKNTEELITSIQYAEVAFDNGRSDIGEFVETIHKAIHAYLDQAKDPVISLIEFEDQGGACG
jgi:hypothetical protein